jgi:hypothetical protein
LLFLPKEYQDGNRRNEESLRETGQGENENKEDTGGRGNIPGQQGLEKEVGEGITYENGKIKKKQ